ncbi:hypothetical protein D3C81_1535710 [compost metagenome]
MAASVEDLPLPVGPVTRIKPWGFLARDARSGGMFNCCNEGMSAGIDRAAMLMPLRCRKTFTRYLTPFASEKEKSASPAAARALL